VPDLYYFYACIMQQSIIRKIFTMPKKNRIILIALIVLNTIVLLGQIWPEGAPPFARIVNIVFLIGSLLFFSSSVKNARKD